MLGNDIKLSCGLAVPDLKEVCMHTSILNCPLTAPEGIYIP